MGNGYKLVILLLLIFSILFVFSLSFGFFHFNPTATHPTSSYLDPIINLSSSNNLITGLSITNFFNGSDLSFTTVNGSETLYAYLRLPKFAVISSSTYNITSQNFTGNIAYTPSVSTSSGAVCKQNHTSFSGYVLINGVNTSVSDKSFVGGLLSASGSCSASVSTSNSCASPGSPYPSSSCQQSTTYYSANPTCSVTLSCNPSTTCCTSETQTVSTKCPSGYSGGSCSSASSPSSGTAVTGTTGYEYEGTSFTASEGSVSTQCNDNPAVSYQYLSYTPEEGGQGNCANTGSTSLTKCSGGGLPSCINYESYTYGTHDSGYTFTCDYSISGSNDGCINQELGMGNGVQCTLPGGCVLGASANAEITGYYGPGPSSSIQPSNFLGAGDSYTVPSDSDQTLYVCTSTVTIPQGDYYTESELSGGCPTPQKLVYNDRIDYPYYNIYYNGALYTGTTTGSISANGGICADQNTLSTVYTSAGSSSPTAACSEAVTNNCASCSPSPVSYSCTGDYNSSTPNRCLTSTSGSIVYSASCPSPGSGTITSVTAIPNSCIDSVNNTAVANLSIVANGDTLFSTTSSFTGTKQLNITSALKSFLSSSSQSNGYSYLPIKFTSDKPGVIKLVNLDIPFSYNVSALYSKSYDIFNTTYAGTFIKPNSSIGYGATINVTSSPYEDIKISGFDSDNNCQIGIINKLTSVNNNASNICPVNITLGTDGEFSYGSASSSTIYIFNKRAEPVSQVFHTAAQNTSKVSIPGVIQYISVPVTLADNESKYGISSALNISFLTPSINGFTFNQTQRYKSVTNGTYNLNLQYSGNEVTSKESVQQGNYVSWSANTIKIEDIWNNTSPYSFANLTKNYTFVKGSKITDCEINGTNVLGTQECKLFNLSNGEINVQVKYNKSLQPKQWLDPTIVAEVPAISLLEYSPSQTSSQLTCLVKLGHSSCTNSSILSPSFTQTADFVNNGTFTYPKINLSASIPAYNQTVPSSIEAVYDGQVVTPYYINIEKGVINWTTYNFSANSTEDWTIKYTGVPLRVEISNYSSPGIFEWDVVLTAPPGLAYKNFYMTMDTPPSTSQQLFPSLSLIGGTTPNIAESLPSDPNVLFTPGLSVSPPQNNMQVEVLTIPANGTIGFVPFADLGKSIQCSIINSTETPVVVGQVIQVSNTIKCFDPNSPAKQTLGLPFTHPFYLPSNAFGVVANLSKFSNSSQPLVSTPLSFIGNHTYVPLSTLIYAKQNKTFVVKYKIQPLAITYKPETPTHFYTNLPALSKIVVSLSNDAPVEIDNASYNIPITQGFNASFVINNTVVSNATQVDGSYPVQFTDVPGDFTEIGTIYYYTPTANVTVYPSYPSITYNNSQILYYSPFAVSSISPIPMQNVSMEANILANSSIPNTCYSTVAVYIASSPSSTTGTKVPYKCYNATMIDAYIGPFNLGQTKYIVIATNASVVSQVVSSSPSPFTGIGSAFSSAWKAIASFANAVKNLFVGLLKLL